MLTGPSQRVRLRIVPSDSVLPHEIADPARETRIKEKLRVDGLLRDPLIVGEVPGMDGYVLLDGTNRKRALEELGSLSVMVQSIDYSDERAVELRTWCHQTPLPTARLLPLAGNIEGVDVRSLAPLATVDALRVPDTLAVVLDRRAQYAISRRRESVASRAEQLRQLVDAYEREMVRVDCGPEDVEEHALSSSDPLTFIAFPPFSRSQVVTMALRRELIPAGITRHVIHQGRALRVNLPLEVLAGNDIERQNQLLQEHGRGLHPRLYREPTILFDS